MRTNRLASMSILAVAGLAASVLAFEPPADPKQPPLSGPQVKERNVPGVNGQFGEGNAAGNGDKRKYAEREIPHPIFMNAIRDGVGENASADVRATTEQMDKIHVIDQDFTKAQREFMEKNRAEFAKLREAGLGEGAFRGDLGKGKGKGAKGGKGAPGGEGAAEPKPGEEMMAPESDAQKAEREAMMEKRRVLMESAPKVGDVHTKIWAVLNEGQQKAVQVRLDAFRAEQRQREGEKYIERQVNKKNPQGAPAAPGEAPKRPLASGPDGQPARVSPEHRERLMRMFEKLSPEEREQLLKRLEERMNGGGGAPPAPGKGKRPARPGPDAGEKPAPPIDDVKVPPPQP